MSQIQAYLTFNGNCREAMQFYQACLGGFLELQTIGSSPMAAQFPANMHNSILQTTLTKNGLTLLGSDMAPSSGLIKGNTVSLMLDCDSEEEIAACYKKLSAGGTKDHPLEKTFWDACFGDLTDKFGNHWLLHHIKKH